jgi:heterodisulfide reductase subunit A2
VEVGEKVAVIGGGNTAVDCARVARRLGGKEVTIIYRRSRAEMPALPEDVASVEKEGIRIDFLGAPRRLISENGRLTGIECLRMKLGSPDASGRAEPTPIEGSEYVVPVDTVLAAIGQAPETDFVKDLGVTVNRRGIIEVSRTGDTGVEGVFAGGDSAGTKAFVADAIASGKMGALAIFCFLEGKDGDSEFAEHRIGEGPSFSFQHFIDPGNYIPDLKNIVPLDKINTLCFTHQGRNDNPDQPPEESVGTFNEVTGGLDPGAAEAEIARCFKCGTCTECDLCFWLCPDISILKAQKGYDVRVDYCKGCGMCATTCPRHVIEMGEAQAAAGGVK